MNEMINEGFAVPAELVDIIVKANAYKNLRDLYVKRPFGYHKALKASHAHIMLITEFWHKIGQLYPETQKGEWHYHTGAGKIRSGYIKTGG